MVTIAEKIKEFIDANGKLSDAGGRFTGNDFNDIMSVLSGRADNFIVFNNGGGNAFEICMYDRMDPSTTVSEFKKFAKSQRAYTYMQKIDGKEKIFRELPSYLIPH